MSPYGPLAEWQERLVSGLIDYVAPWILFGILSTILAFSSDDNSVVFAFNPLSFFITLLPVAWALYMGYLAGTTGQSLGMKQSGLRCVGEATGQPIGASQGLVRNLLFAVAWLANCLCYFGGLLVLIDSLFPLWDSEEADDPRQDRQVGRHQALTERQSDERPRLRAGSRLRPCKAAERQRSERRGENRMAKPDLRSRS